MSTCQRLGYVVYECILTNAFRMYPCKCKQDCDFLRQSLCLFRVFFV